MSDETLKLPGLPEPAAYTTQIKEGRVLFEPRVSLNVDGMRAVYAADQFRELQRQTVEVCAKVIEQRTLRTRQASAWTNSEPIKPCELAEALRSLLDQS